jgi:hypothetical protein
LRWRQVTSSRRLIINNPQRLPHYHHWAGPGTSLRSCRGSRTLNTAPADPEIIAIKTKHAKSKRIAVTESKNKHDVDIVVYSKFKRIAIQVSV